MMVALMDSDFLNLDSLEACNFLNACKCRKAHLHTLCGVLLALSVQARQNSTEQA